MGRLVCTVVILSACMQWAVGAETDTAYVERYSLWRQTYEQALQNPAMMTQAYTKADGNTLVVVTADHATGALTLQDGDLEAGRIGVAFGNQSHNGIAVPYYVWGPGRDRFNGILENAELGALIASFIQ